jgi:DNA-binding response OmpR family regulator
MIDILIVEDEKTLNELFAAALSRQGYQIHSAFNGLEALQLFEEKQFDLVISDIMMPEMNGFELIRLLRIDHTDLPILIVSAKGTMMDKQEGFRIGTDDYMTKPIDVNEMVWRVEALLRRAKILNEKKASIGNTTLDMDSYSVICGDSEETLPQKEFLILYKLISSPNRTYTRKQIMDDIWGIDIETNTHSLEVHISRLRERYKENKDFEIITVRGLGYKVVKKDA